MSEAPRNPLKTLVLGTRLGRLSLLAAGLAGVFAFLPSGCAKRGDKAADASASAGDEKGKGELPASPQGFDDTLTLGQKYDSLIRRWGTDLSQTKGELDSARKELEGLRNALAEERAKAAGEKKEMADVLKRLEQGLQRDLGQAAPPPEEERRPREGAGSASGPGGIRTIVLAQSREKAESKRPVHIPTASGALATLLNGVFAPVSGEPSPVRLRLDAALLGPNRSRIGLREAFLIGKAQGDANSSRVTVQVDRMSYVARDGRTIETKVLGYVVGTDGLEGVPGAYEWRAGELLPLAVGSSALASGSEALAAGETSRSLTPLGGAIETVSGDALKFAGFRSAAGGAGKLSEILAERMREIRPAVSARAGQAVTVVFLEGVTLEGLDAQEISLERDDDPFRGLDAHR